MIATASRIVKDLTLLRGRNGPAPMGNASVSHHIFKRNIQKAGMARFLLSRGAGGLSARGQGAVAR